MLDYWCCIRCLWYCFCCSNCAQHFPTWSSRPFGFLALYLDVACSFQQWARSPHSWNLSCRFHCHPQHFLQSQMSLTTFNSSGRSNGSPRLVSWCSTFVSTMRSLLTFLGYSWTLEIALRHHFVTWIDWLVSSPPKWVSLLPVSKHSRWHYNTFESSFSMSQASSLCVSLELTLLPAVIPMVTQSDPGTEKFGIANMQTMLRQMHDPTLQGFV